MKLYVILPRLLGLATIAYFLSCGVFEMTATPEKQVLRSLRASAPLVKTDGKSAASRLEDYEIIGRRNLLGALHFTDKAPDGGLEALPASRLNWKLLGTVMSENPSLRRAVALVDGQQKIVRENEKVGDWLVARIEREAIALSRGETREVLRAEVQPALARVAVASGGEGGSLSRGMLRSGFGDPGALSQDVRLVPATYGSQKGMRITSLREGSLPRTLGLAKGDLLLQINTLRLESLADLAAISELAEESAIELTVLRGTQKVVLRYEIQE